ncbi:hypothetical protein HDU93_006307, partial [Gonapodya sp. JEL0774]
MTMIAEHGHGGDSVTRVDVDKSVNATDGPSATGMSSASSKGAIPPDPESIERTSRERKANALYLYEKQNPNGRYNTRKFDMNDSIEDIENALAIVTTRRASESNLGFWRHALCMCTEGIVWANTTFDPLGVDLRDWAANLQTEIVQRGNYDEILEELVQKYNKGGSKMPVEARLAMAVGGSLVMSVVVKRREKRILEEMIAEDAKPTEAERQREAREQGRELARQREREEREMDRQRETERLAAYEREREKERTFFMQQLNQIQVQIAALQQTKG